MFYCCKVKEYKLYIYAKKTYKTNKKIVIFTNIWYTNIKQKSRSTRLFATPCGVK